VYNRSEKKICQWNNRIGVQQRGHSEGNLFQIFTTHLSQNMAQHSGNIPGVISAPVMRAFHCHSQSFVCTVKPNFVRQPQRHCKQGFDIKMTRAKGIGLMVKLTGALELARSKPPSGAVVVSPNWPTAGLLYGIPVSGCVRHHGMFRHARTCRASGWSIQYRTR
jgi:hypothetical protein